jgi:hypothetical protein
MARQILAPWNCCGPSNPVYSAASGGAVAGEAERTCNGKGILDRVGRCEQPRKL